MTIPPLVLSKDQLISQPAVVVIDISKPWDPTPATITYRKEADDEFWERYNDGQWISPNLYTYVGTKTADTEGSFRTRPLKPGDRYEAGIFAKRQGPTSPDRKWIRHIKVSCLHQGPASKNLIVDHVVFRSGGTWIKAFSTTKIKTFPAMAGVSYKPIPTDANGLPDPSAFQSLGWIDVNSLSTQWQVEFGNLFPGNDFYAVVVVADEFGNWQVAQGKGRLLVRSVFVSVPRIEVIDDGDDDSDVWGPDAGESSYSAEVRYGAQSHPFFYPREDHYEGPFDPGWGHPFGPHDINNDGDNRLAVSSTGWEHDQAKTDEEAGQGFVELRWPTGEGTEEGGLSQVIDCPSTNNQSFHYSFEIHWKATYN